MYRGDYAGHCIAGAKVVLQKMWFSRAGIAETFEYIYWAYQAIRILM